MGSLGFKRIRCKVERNLNTNDSHNAQHLS